MVVFIVSLKYSLDLIGYSIKNYNENNVNIIIFKLVQNDFCEKNDANIIPFIANKFLSTYFVQFL